MNSYLRETLKQRDAFYMQINKQVAEQKAINEQLLKQNFRDLMSRTPIYQKLHILIKANRKDPDLKKVLEDDEWETLEKEIQNHLSGFIPNLKGRFNRLTEKDIHLCYLLKLGFEPMDISFIFACTKDAVYKHQKSMKKRMRIADDVILAELLEGL